MSDHSSGCGGDSDLEYNSGSEMSSASDNLVLLNENTRDGQDSEVDSLDMIILDEEYGTDESLSGAGESSSGNGSSEEEEKIEDEDKPEDKPLDKESGKNKNDFYFEGVEKLLEIWFTRQDGKLGDSCNLRRIPRYQLEEMLKLVHCEIIDSVSNDEIDSYVLRRSKKSMMRNAPTNESSLFVSQRRLILKTCGTTTPLQCLKFLWTLVKDYTGFDCIEDVYYSHKNYKRPHVQKLPYRKFDNEVQLLDEFFQDSGNPSGGSAYCLGSMNRDCWYLYTYHAPMSTKNKGIMHHRFGSAASGPGIPRNILGHPNTHHHRKNVRSGAGRITKGGHQGHGHNNSNQLIMQAMNMLTFDEPDQTLEILMSDLDQSVMQIFTQEQCKTAKEATLKSGINRIIPGMIINDHLFEPCGYSMNGIIQDQGTYMTIHITPEAEFSYVSFETNIAMSSYKDIIGRVLEIFRPGKFVLTFFANKASKGHPAHKEMNKMSVINDRWLRMDNQFCRLEKNDLTYAMYTKFPS